MKKYLSVICSLFFLATVTHAQNIEDILTKVQKRYDGVKDLSAMFSQTVRFGVTRSTQTFEGKLWMKKGNKYRIELEDQTIVTDGASVWTYSEANNQVLIDRFQDDPKAITPDRILTSIPKNYFSTLIGKESVGGAETHIIKLIPKDDRSTVKSMKVWVGSSEWIIKKVEIVDTGDTQTTYLVSDVKLNVELSDKKFQFEIPKGVEVVDLRTSP